VIGSPFILCPGTSFQFLPGGWGQFFYRCARRGGAKIWKKCAQKHKKVTIFTIQVGGGANAPPCPHLPPPNDVPVCVCILNRTTALSVSSVAVAYSVYLQSRMGAEWKLFATTVLWICHSCYLCLTHHYVRILLNVMNVRMNDWVNRWMIEWIDEWLSESMNRWMIEWIDEWLSESMNDW